MTYAVSERANATRKVQSKFHKITKQLKNANKTKLLCIIRNIVNACLRILIIPYLLPIVYGESLYFNHNNFIQTEKTAGTRHLRTLLCTLINLHAAFTSKAVTPVLQRDIAS